MPHLTSPIAELFSVLLTQFDSAERHFAQAHGTVVVTVLLGPLCPRLDADGTSGLQIECGMVEGCWEFDLLLRSRSLPTNDDAEGERDPLPLPHLRPKPTNGSRTSTYACLTPQHTSSCHPLPPHLFPLPNKHPRSAPALQPHTCPLSRTVPRSCTRR